MPAAPSPISTPPPPPGATRRPLRHTRSVSLTASVAIHATVLALTGLLVWRVAEPSLSGPQTVITFESPSLGDDAPAARPTTEPVIARPAPEVRIDEFAPTIPDASASPPRLEGLSSPHAAAPTGASLPERLSSSQAAASTPPESWATDAAASARPVSFAGLGASNARSVVYVVDCSGSMVTSLPFVIAEVERSIEGLSPTQKFGVVIFREPLTHTPGSHEDKVEVFAPILLRATASARARLHEWLSRVRPSGRSAPMPGLERAVEFTPDAIFLLSRSIERGGGNAWDRSLGDALARVDALNPARADGSRPILIQTIQFLDNDPTGIMQEIGRAHGSTRDVAGRAVAGYRLIKRGEDLGGER
ncbi:MAG: hypothetical protein IT438_10765 [Phycisphaerales bacterium]|nr:hypothetical protein [Phycisphaerales bacterium]